MVESNSIKHSFHNSEQVAAKWSTLVASLSKKHVGNIKCVLHLIKSSTQ